MNCRLVRSLGLLCIASLATAPALLPGCSKDSKAPTPPAGDTTSPAAIADLAVSSPAGRLVTLTWTAPGDDGAQGQASRYEIRYAAAAITQANWDSARAVASPPAPKVAGLREELDIEALADSTWHFAVKSADEVPNWSSLSNIVSVTVADATAPGAVTDLGVSASDGHSLTLLWTAPGNDGAVGIAAEYDLRYAELPIDEDSWAAAIRVPQVPPPQPHGSMELFLLDALQPGRTYSFALKTVDAKGNWSLLSNCATGATTADLIPPESVPDLTACCSGEGSVTLRWTAPGNDGASGRAVAYDIRYSASLIVDDNWDAATLVADLPAPALAGTVETFTIAGLEPGQTLYFALKTADGVPAWSGLSNACAATAGTAILRRLMVAERDQWYMDAAWSPDGGSITFDVTGQEIYRMTADCGRPIRLVGPEFLVAYPTWSPDGTRIACNLPGVDFPRTAGLWIIDAASGENRTPVAGSGGGAIRDCAWSADGTRIAYATNPPVSPGQLWTNEIYTIPASGGDPVLLIGGPWVYNDPAWSPDNERIAFSSNRSGNREIWIVPAAGGDPVQLTHEGAGAPSWSPDGGRIAFGSSRSGTGQIWIMSADGTDLRQITFDDLSCFSPAWSPDGTRIAFSRERRGEDPEDPRGSDLWILELD